MCRKGQQGKTLTFPIFEIKDRTGSSTWHREFGDHNYVTCAFPLNEVALAYLAVEQISQIYKALHSLSLGWNPPGWFYNFSLNCIHILPWGRFHCSQLLGQNKETWYLGIFIGQEREELPSKDKVSRTMRRTEKTVQFPDVSAVHHSILFISMFDW